MINKGITVRFSAHTAKFDAGAEGMKKALRLLKSECVGLSKSMRFDSGNLQIVKAKYANIEEQIRVNKRVLAEYEAEQKKLDENGSPKTKKWMELQIAINKCKSEDELLNGQLAKTKQSIEELKPGSVVQLNKEFKEFGEDLRLVNKRLELDPKNIDLAKRKTKLLADMTDTAKQRLTKLRQEQAKLGQDQIHTGEWRKLQRQIDKTELDLRKLSGTAKKTGFNLKQSMAFGAVAGGVATGVAVVSNKLGDLRREAMQGSDAMTKFTSTMEFAGKSEQEINKTRTMVKKYADETVYDIETIANTTAQLSANGVEGYDKLVQAAGNLNSVAGGSKETFGSVAMVMTQTAGAGKLTTENWNQLADAVPGASGLLQDAMREAGAYTGNFREAMEKGQITADEFNDAIMKLGFEEKAVEAAKSAETFEGMFGQMEAAVVDRFMRILDMIGKENLSAAVAKMTRGIEKFFDWIEFAVKGLLKLFDWLNSGSIGADAFKAVVVGLVTALVGLKVALTGMKIFNTLKPMVLGLNAAMAANPAVLITVAVAALVAGLIYFFTQTKTGKKLVDDMSKALRNGWEKFKELGNQIKGFVEPILHGFVTTVKNVAKWVMDKFNAVADGVKGFSRKVHDAIENAKKWIIDKLRAGLDFAMNVAKSFGQVGQNVINFFRNGLANLSGMLHNLISGALNGAKNVGLSIAGGFGQIGHWVIDRIVGVLGGLAGGVVSRISGAFHAALNAARGVIGAFSSIGRSIIDAILGGLSGIGRMIGDKVRGAIDGAKRMIGNVGSWFKGSDGGDSVGFGGFGGGMAGIYRMKMAGMAAMPNVTNTYGNRTTLNIRVDGTGMDELALARRLEQIIVRNISD